MGEIEKKIKSLVELETQGWDTKDPDLFLSVIHADMVWPWPPDPDAHDPAEWVFELGRFDRARWREKWQQLFDTCELVHNSRETVKIEVSREGDAAFAVVDIDTLWRNTESGIENHWEGRVCKIYTLMPGGEWKLVAHTGALHYPPKHQP